MTKGSLVLPLNTSLYLTLSNQSEGATHESTTVRMDLEFWGQMCYLVQGRMFRDEAVFVRIRGNKARQKKNDTK